MTRRSPLVIVAVGAMLLVRVASPRVAFADPPPSHDAATPPEAQQEGREHFTRGVALYREGNFGAARIEFQRAYDIAPSYRILFNLAESAFELHDYAGALMAFMQYLSEGGERVSAARRAEVEKSIHDLEQRIGRVEITTSPPGADVAIDGAKVGTSPLAAPVIVSVGRRVVTATLAGHVRAESAVDVASGDHASVRLELAEEPVALPVALAVVPSPASRIEPPEKPVPQEKPSPSWAPVWIGASVTGALIGGTVVFGALTVAANSSLNTQLGEFPGSASRIASDRSEVHSYGVVADVLGGAAIVGAGTTVYLALTRRRSHSPAPPTVGLGPGTVRLAGQF